MTTILTTLLLVFAICDVFLIGCVQTSKSNGIQGLTGEGLALFEQTKVRGTEKKIQNMVIFNTVMIFGLIVLLSYII